MSWQMKEGTDGLRMKWSIFSNYAQNVGMLAPRALAVGSHAPSPSLGDPKQVLYHWATPPAPHWGILGRSSTTEPRPQPLTGDSR